MMKARGMKDAGLGQPMTSQICMTPEQVNADKPPAMSNREVKLRHQGAEPDRQLDAARRSPAMAAMEGVGHSEMSWRGNEHYEGTYSFKGTRGRPAAEYEHALYRRLREGRLRRGEAFAARAVRMPPPIDGRRRGACRSAARQPARGGVHRRRHVHRIRHSRFPLARRHLDQDDAGRFPGLYLPIPRRGACRGSGASRWKRPGTPLQPNDGHRAVAELVAQRQGQPCHHPEYRRPAPGRRRAGRTGDRAARQHPLCQMPGLRHAGARSPTSAPISKPMAMRPIARPAAASSRPPPSPSARPCRKAKWRAPRPRPWPAT